MLHAVDQQLCCFGAYTPLLLDARVPVLCVMRLGRNARSPHRPVPCAPRQVALEAILLWTKTLFYGLAVDGLGTFI